jgi:hypothetical protein
MHLRSKFVAVFASLMALAAAPGMSHAQSPMQDLDIFAGREAVARLAAVPHQQLKDQYLRCERSVMEGARSFGDIALCSIIYEALLQHAFKGDFGALLAWSKAQPAVAAGDPAATARLP